MDNLEPDTPCKMRALVNCIGVGNFLPERLIKNHVKFLCRELKSAECQKKFCEIIKKMQNDLPHKPERIAALEEMKRAFGLTSSDDAMNGTDVANLIIRQQNDLYPRDFFETAQVLRGGRDGR